MFEMKVCTKVTGFEEGKGFYLLHADHADIKLCFLTDEVVRVRTSFDRTFDEESYILMTTAWEDRLDSVIGADRTRIEPVVPEVCENEGTIRFSTKAVSLLVTKSPITLQLFDGVQPHEGRGLLLWFRRKSRNSEQE